jgi:hypothetical protein
MWAAILFVGMQTPAHACQFLDASAESAAIEQAARDTEELFLFTIALAVPVLALDVLRKRFSVPLLLLIPVLAFHPFWVFRPFYGTNCQFEDVLVSEWLLALAVLLLATRILTESGRATDGAA